MVLIHPLIAFASVIGLVSSESSTTLNIDDIDLSQRDYWCESQKSACPLLCTQLPGASDNPTSNDCDPQTLDYSCICDNGKSPNASEYSQTIPYFLCTAQNNQCVLDCPQSNLACQSNCRTDNPCGAQSPKRINATSTVGSNTTNTGPTTSSVAPFTGEPDEGLAIRLSTDMAPIYGLAIVLGGFFAGFTTLL